MCVGTGWTSDWRRVDNGLALNRHWTDARLAVGWRWIGNRFTSYWLSIDSGSAMNWHLIGNRLGRIGTGLAALTWDWHEIGDECHQIGTKLDSDCTWIGHIFALHW